MKLKLFFELKDGSHDSLIVEGDDINEIRTTAQAEKEKRAAVDAWSEVIER